MQAKLKGAIWASLAGFAFAGVALVATQMATLAGTLLASHQAFAAAAAAKSLLQPTALRAEAPTGFKQAFAKLAPSTQRFFGEPDRFLRSLAQDMPTVLDTRRFAFLGVEQVGQRTVQQVLITDSTEHEWLAEFQLEQMKSGDWRVKGCILQSTPGQQA